MSLEINNLFRDRFQGHEAPVGPDAWDAIQSKLAAGATIVDPVNDLFRKSFQGHEVAVDPGAWANISGQLGHSVATGSSGIWGWAAAGVTALVIGGAAYFMTGQTTVAIADLPAVTEETRVPVVRNNVGSAIVEIPTDRSVQVEKAVPGISAEPKPQQVITSTSQVDPQEPSARNIPPIILEEPAEETHTVPTVVKQDNPVSVNSNAPKTVYGPIIVAQIIDELTTKAAQAATQETAGSDENGDGEVEQVEVVTGSSMDEEVTEDLPALPELFIPNTFTPNGDNINDSFEVGAEGFEKVMIRIFSVKDNVQVFSTNTGEAWDGANCRDGYYLVAIEAITADGRSVTAGKVVWLNTNR